MSLQINEELKNIVYENGSVCLPGLGVIKSSYQPASIDYNAGKFAPPSSYLEFHDGEFLNDGKLIEYLCSKYHLTPEEAAQETQYFITESLSALEARRPVVLPEIGRLFKNANNKIQFLADASRSDPETFGLPDVQFFPVPRQPNQPEKTTRPANNPVYTQRPPLQASSEKASVSPDFSSIPNAAKVPPLEYVVPSTLLPNRYPQSAITKYPVQTLLPGTMVVLLMALSAWIFFSKNTRGWDTEYKTNQKNMAHINVKPVFEGAGASDTRKNDPPVKAANEQPAADLYIDKKETNASGQMEIAAISPPASEKEAVALIGGFRNKENARKLVEKMQEAGFKPSTRKKNNVTLVDCSILYDNYRDLHHKLTRIRQLFGPEINLIKQ